MIRGMLYRTLGRVVSIFFNVLNILLLGNMPPLGCACVIAEDQGRFLVVDRGGGRFVFPGGFMRWRERPMQTAERECEEETGLRVKIRGAIGYQSIISTRMERMSTIVMIYQGEVVGGTLRSSIEGQACWRDVTELRGRMILQYEGILSDYLAHREQHAKFLALSE